MIVTTCQHCQTLIYGGLSKGVWVDSEAGNINTKRLCKDPNVPGHQYHEPHIWYTQGDGQVVYDNRYHRYMFIEAPSPEYNLGVGEFMPEDWSIQ